MVESGVHTSFQSFLDQSFSFSDSLCNANVDSEDYTQDDRSTLELGALMLLEY